LSLSPSGFELNWSQVPQGRMDSFGHIHILKEVIVRVQDIVNSFRQEFYLVEGSGHRELP
jgi:hypothetical protein